MADKKDQRDSNMEDKHKHSNDISSDTSVITDDNSGYSSSSYCCSYYIHSMLQWPSECFEEVIGVILRCLGFQQHSSSYTTPADTTTSTTTVIEVGEEEKGCPSVTSDLSGSGDGYGDGGDSGEGAESPPTDTVGFQRMARRRPPRPVIGTGRDPQIN